MSHAALPASTLEGFHREEVFAGELIAALFGQPPLLGAAADPVENVSVHFR